MALHLCMVLYVRVWSHMFCIDMYGLLRPCMVFHGPVGSSLVLYELGLPNMGGWGGTIPHGGAVPRPSKKF